MSGWHHHGGHDTIVYVISGHVAIEFGEGGRRAVQAGAGDFLVIPSGLVHRESTPGQEPSRSVVIRAGGDGPPTIEVDGVGWRRTDPGLVLCDLVQESVLGDAGDGVVPHGCCCGSGGS